MPRGVHFHRGVRGGRQGAAAGTRRKQIRSAQQEIPGQPGRGAGAPPATGKSAGMPYAAPERNVRHRHHPVVRSAAIFVSNNPIGVKKYENLMRASPNTGCIPGRSRRRRPRHPPRQPAPGQRHSRDGRVASGAESTCGAGAPGPAAAPGPPDTGSRPPHPLVRQGPVEAPAAARGSARAARNSLLLKA
jgi:hypothetical protein